MEKYVIDQEFEDHIDFVREQQKIGKYWNVLSYIFLFYELSYPNDF